MPHSPPPEGSSARELRDRLHFERIAPDYTAKDISASCRPARRHRARATLELLPPDNDRDLLEVGCGAGFAARYLEGTFRSYLGIDYAANLIRMARTHHESTATSFVVANGRDFQSDRRFDAIFMIGVLHHVSGKDSLVANLVRLLRPGGWIVANEPQPDNPAIRLARRARAVVDGAYSSEQEQLSTRDVRMLFDRNGLGNIRTRAQGFLSTPFAEVPLRPRSLFSLVCRAAVFGDRMIERSGLGAGLAWNGIVAGQKPTLDGTPEATG